MGSITTKACADKCGHSEPQIEQDLSQQNEKSPMRSRVRRSTILAKRDVHQSDSSIPSSSLMGTINNHSGTTNSMSRFSNASPLGYKARVESLLSHNKKRLDRYEDIFSKKMAVLNEGLNTTHSDNVRRVEYKNGAIFRGHFSENMRHGLGIMQWPNGSTYIGDWKMDKACGLGKLEHKNGSRYQGEWLANKAHGNGIYLDYQGGFYSGQWAHDQHFGEGVELTENKTLYEGYFVNGLKSGQGLIYFHDGEMFYQGDFVDDQMHGFGTFIWYNKRHYIGQFKNNKIEGQGQLEWLNGDKYQGSFLENYQHGHGVITWHTGSYYDGNWFMGMQHGKGELSLGQLTPIYGFWRFGRQLGIYPNKQDFNYNIERKEMDAMQIRQYLLDLRVSEYELDNYIQRENNAVKLNQTLQRITKNNQSSIYSQRKKKSQSKSLKNAFSIKIKQYLISSRNKQDILIQRLQKQTELDLCDNVYTQKQNEQQYSKAKSIRRQRQQHKKSPFRIRKGRQYVWIHRTNKNKRKTTHYRK